MPMCFLCFLGSNFHHSDSSPFLSCLQGQSHLWHLSAGFHGIYLSDYVNPFFHFLNTTFIGFHQSFTHLYTVLLPLPCFNTTPLHVSSICFLILWEMINLVTTIDCLGGFPGIVFQVFLVALHSDVLGNFLWCYFCDHWKDCSSMFSSVLLPNANFVSLVQHFSLFLSLAFSSC